jgi:type IV pilus assembly protein PilC
MKKKNRQFSHDELSVFCFELSLMLKSGLPLIEGIELLFDDIENSGFKKIVGSLRDDILNGENLHSSLSKHKEFPEYMTSIVRIAELSGNLDTEMERLSVYYEKLSQMNDRIARAVTYPIMLGSMMVVVITILILKVIPIFKDILVSIGGDIPPATAAIFGASNFLGTNIMPIALAILALIIGLALYFSTGRGRMAWKKWLTSSSLMKGIYSKIIAAKFARSMSLMLKSGITFEEALMNVVDVLDNEYAKDRIVKSLESFGDSYDIAGLIEGTNLMPNLFIKMLRVGTQTGETEKVFDKLSGMYDLQVEKSINRFTSIIEPLMIGILSTVIGIILISVILPMINIMSSIG